MPVSYDDFRHNRYPKTDYSDQSDPLDRYRRTGNSNKYRAQNPTSYNDEFESGRYLEPRRGLRGRDLHSLDDRDRYYDPGSSTPPPQNPKRRNQGDYVNARKKKHHVFPIVLLLILILIAVGTGIFAAKVDKNLHSFPVPEQQALDDAVSPSGIWGIQPVNILLLGSDARADDPGMGARTDAIVLAHIDPNAKTVSMVSLPRDTLIQDNEYGTYKLNAAYAYGGASKAVETVENLCGVKIDHCAVIDFAGLAGLVDAIGGIDVVVDETIDNPKAGDVAVPAGPQHINGAQALVMSRDRDYVDGDYTRQSNQRKVISGILHRILNLAPWEMPGAVEGCSMCLATDSSTGTLGIMLLALRMKVPWANMQLRTTVLPSQPADIDGISYVVADRAGTRELISRFDSGKSIEEPVMASSIDEDIVNVRGW